MREINSTNVDGFEKDVNRLIEQEDIMFIQPINFNAEIVPTDSYDKIGYTAFINTSKELEGQSIKADSLVFKVIVDYDSSKVESFIKQMTYEGYALVQPIKHMELSVKGFSDNGERIVYIAFIVYTTEVSTPPIEKNISIEYFESKSSKEGKVETESQRKAREVLEFLEAGESDDEEY